MSPCSSSVSLNDESGDDPASLGCYISTPGSCRSASPGAIDATGSVEGWGVCQCSPTLAEDGMEVVCGKVSNDTAVMLRLFR
eukprot:26551-Eustigmatos_ZCMA.PRE.1